MDKVFEEAYRRRRRHEYTLTSSMTNVHYYGSPAYSRKQDIWPPISSDVESIAAPKFSPKLIDRLFTAPKEPLHVEPPPTASVQGQSLYKPLYDGHVIRLIELQPGQYDDALILTFHYANLQRGHLPYEALSYVWGNARFVRQARKTEVRVNGHQLQISTNLEHAFRHLRYTQKSRLLWADSLCIDQSDVRERGHQVSLMSEVYSSAWRVVVWLGDAWRWEREGFLKGVEDLSAEHGFGALCEVVNHWLQERASERRASYRIIERDGGSETQARPKVFGGFEMESTTIRDSAAIKDYFSKPEEDDWFTPSPGLSREVEVYLRRKYGTYKPEIKYSLDGTHSELEDPSEDPKLQANKDSAPTSAFWKALETLFSSTWFWRLWVFQEIVLARSAVVRWGHCEIDWRYVGLASAILRTNHHEICEKMKMGGLYNAYLMFRMSKLSDLPPVKLDFLRSMQLTRQFDVTDSRDRVYGLLGIAMEDNHPEQGELFLKPDYGIESGELWKRVAMKVIAQSKKLAPLSSVQYSTGRLEFNRQVSFVGLWDDEGRTKGDVPSWIPQWNVVFRASLSPWDVEERFSASRGLAITDMRFEGDKLMVPGVEIGMVVYTLRFMWHDIDLSLLWSQHLQGTFKTEEGLRLLARTLTAGRNAYGSIVHDSDAAVADLAAHVLTLQGGKPPLPSHLDGSYLSRAAQDTPRPGAHGPDPRLLQRLAIGGSAARFVETALAYCERRRLFVTANGFLGLGADTVAEGDVLAVLAGGDLPFVLRPKSHDGEVKAKGVRRKTVRAVECPEYHQLVGESYVQGLMEGQMEEALAEEREIRGPLESVQVMRELLEKTKTPGPWMGMVTDEEERDKHRQVNELTQPMKDYLLQVDAKHAELRMFEIR